MVASRIYLDHAATTPLLPAAREAMADGLVRWANPSSPHAEGRAARARLEQARGAIAAALGWTGAVVLTSGATEAVAMALTRPARPRPVIRSAVEHAAVSRATPDAAVVPVGRDGLVDRDALGRLLAAYPEAIVAIQQVNSETGVIQPLDALAQLVRDAGGLVSVDCAQGGGKLPLPDADLIAVSAHKLGGPPGIGALLVRDLAVLHAGGGQERGYRAGTENLPAALGFAAALADGPISAPDRLRARLDDAVRAGGGAVVCDASPRSPFIAAYRMPGMAAAAQLIRLDLMGFAVSAGSACSSGSLKPSPVLEALALGPAADEVIRVSFGRDTGTAEVDAFAAAWIALAEEARGRRAA